MSIIILSRAGGESQECFEDAASDQGWILILVIFNFQHFMDLSTQKSYVLHTFSSFNICEIRYIYQKVSQYLERPLLKLDVIGQLAQQDSKTYQDSPSFQQGFIRLPCDQCFFSRTLLFNTFSNFKQKFTWFM